MFLVGNLAYRYLIKVSSLLAPWAATATLFFGTRGQWLAALGCCLLGGSMAALGLDRALWSRRTDMSEREGGLETDQSGE